MPEIRCFMSLTNINLIRIDFPTPVYLAEFGHDVFYDGNTYRAGTSLLVEIGDVDEESSVNTTTFDLTLAATPEIIQLLLSGSWLNVPITYYQLWKDGDTLLDVMVAFRGRIVEQQREDSLDEHLVQFSCSSHFLDWESKSIRTTSNATQQIFSPGDRGFEHAGKEKKNIKWGK